MNMVIFVLCNEYYFEDLFSYSTLIEESQNWNMWNRIFANWKLQNAISLIVLIIQISNALIVRTTEFWNSTNLHYPIPKDFVSFPPISFASHLCKCIICGHYE